jgi:hypothetical protein
MNKFVDRLLGDDFVWTAVTENLPARRGRTKGNYVTIDCPVCVLNGETPDRKKRCGITRNPDGVGVNCFNCGERLRWKTGDTLSRRWERFMVALGMPDIEVKRLSHKALQYRSILEKSPEAMAYIPEVFTPSFPPKALPEGARPFSAWAEEASPPQDFIDAAEYLFSRGETIATAMDYYWSPSKKGAMNRRVIVPFRHDGQIVGYTARAIDAGTGRYHMEAPGDFLFNARAMSIPSRKYIILSEGVFDAIAIDGPGLLGARLNPKQIAWIKSFGKTVIMVPDRDSRGQSMIDVALEQKWRVAFPTTYTLGEGEHQWWESDVKDCAEAVKRYGRLWTLMSIIESSTDSKLAINIYRKRFT